MSIEKIVEFAENGDKSISGLNITTGFPRQQKPYRQWMNYLFNWLSSKTNEVIDEVNSINENVKPLFEPIRVGELFITTADYQSSEQVAERHGYGGWVRFAEGRTLVGYSPDEDAEDNYRIMGNTFGADTHTITIEESAKHKHSVNNVFNKFTGKPAEVESKYLTSPNVGKTASGLPDNLYMENNAFINGMNQTAWNDMTEQQVGGNKPHNNIQPSIVVAYWLRVS